MQRYHLKLTAKSIFFNFFRRLFTIQYFENFLVSIALKNGPSVFLKLIPPEYLYRKNSIRNITRDGINYNLDISNIVDHYLYFGVKDTGYASIMDVIEKAAIILDVGANIGTTSLFFANLNSKARIFSFEPHPDTFKRAQENIRINKFKNVQLINIGLGEKKETLKLYEVNENNPGANRIISEEQNYKYKLINVDMLETILDDHQITKVDFIKIDVEGFEYSVLKGGGKFIKANPVLFIELDDNNLKANNKSAKELIQLLVTFGYKEFYRADNLIPITMQSDFSNCHYDIVAK